MKKLWEKGRDSQEHIDQFTIGRDREMDMFLAPYDVLGSMAHANMLAEIGMISAEENQQLQRTLTDIQVLIEQGSFVIEEGVEDVHSQVEILLTRKLGDTGKKIHLARSRNDQVLVDLRLYFRAEMHKIKEACLDTARVFIESAERYQDILMPGYTHTQVGMISSFGLWFSAYAEALIDDASYIAGISREINKNPLGTAAGYGSSIAIDRQSTTTMLGFDGLCVNPINAQLQRGKTEMLVGHGLSSLALTLNKFTTDICFYCNENYRLVRLPAHLTTGSSIMPHKKNPDVFELIRGHSHTLMSLSMRISHSISNLVSGYHRDFQLLKAQVIPDIELAKQILSLVKESVPQIEVLAPDMNDEKYKYLYSVEVVNNLVKEGVPFREAYQQVAQMIENREFNPSTEINHTHIGSMGNLGLEILKDRISKLE